jgi:hypothetical protein
VYQPGNRFWTFQLIEAGLLLVLDRASRGWRGFTMTAAGLRQLQDLRRQLLEPPPSLQRNSPPGENIVPGRGTAVA